MSVSSSLNTKLGNIKSSSGEPGQFHNGPAASSQKHAPVMPPAHAGARVSSGGSGSVAVVNPLQELVAHRERLREAIRGIEASNLDMTRYERDGASNANYAAVCAAVLMTVDIIKVALSAEDARAAKGFEAIDKSVEKANKILKIFGKPTIATRQDVLRSVDPNLKPKVEMLNNLRNIRKFLKEQPDVKLPKDVPEELPKAVGLLFDLGVVMAEDSILIVQAQQVEESVHTTAQSARAQARRQLHQTKERLRQVDEEVTRLIEALERKSRTA